MTSHLFSFPNLLTVLAAGVLFSGAALACPECGCEGDHSHPHPHADEAKATDLSAFEQDRKAILAMAGEFEVVFQFQETVAIEQGYELKKPYHETATEFVEVLADTGEFISLQHILVAHEEGKDPVVVKHWRQDWTYQDTEILTFKGHRNWDIVTRSEDEVQGTWSQAVYQVDDSPRYEAIGKWEHLGERSAWESEVTWRPLPRREHTKRSDYHVMQATNRHTISPAGWVHEQDNQKLVLDEAGNPVRIIAHESGLNVYDTTDAVDFSAGREYWEDTAAYWSDVRELWAEALDEPGRKNVAVMVGPKPLFAQMFKIARDIRETGEYTDAHRQQAQQLIEASMMGGKQQAQAAE